MSDDRVPTNSAAASSPQRRWPGLMICLVAMLLTMVSALCDFVTVAGDYTAVLIAAMLTAGASLSMVAFGLRNRPRLLRDMLLVALVDVAVLLDAGARLVSAR